VQVRVRPSALAALDEACGEEGRSVWLRALIVWALRSGWQPGQEWKRNYGQLANTGSRTSGNLSREATFASVDPHPTIHDIRTGLDFDDLDQVGDEGA
jgi:hypothetical protein